MSKEEKEQRIAMLKTRWGEILKGNGAIVGNEGNELTRLTKTGVDIDPHHHSERRNNGERER